MDDSDPDFDAGSLKDSAACCGDSADTADDEPNVDSKGMLITDCCSRL